MDHIQFLADRSASICFEKVDPKLQKLMSLKGLVTGKPLTVSAYPYKRLQSYCEGLLKAGEIDLVFLFSAATAPILPEDIQVKVLVDLVDVDSQKWVSFGKSASWPLSWLYQREGKMLGDYEHQIASKAEYTALVSEQEADLFRSLNTNLSPRIKAIPNGVDLKQFNPKPIGEKNCDEIVLFTGAMDYQPNIEAVIWFTNKIWPAVLKKKPNAVFRIAGGPAAKSVVALGKNDQVEVMGYVEDMAVEISKATVCVAPLRTARGIQNKVLEAMAMSKAIVTTSLANEGINAVCGRDLSVADTEERFSEAVIDLLDEPESRQAMGSSARNFVEDNFTWDQAFKKLDQLIGECL